MTSVTMALSPLEKAKRAFVSILLLLARAHGLALGISRESPDPAVLTAFRRVSRKVHPGRGGSLAESQRLNAARDAWDEARRRPQGLGRPAQQQREGATSGEQVLLPTVSATKGADFASKSSRRAKRRGNRRAKQQAQSEAEVEAGERKAKRREEGEPGERPMD